MVDDAGGGPPEPSRKTKRLTRMVGTRSTLVTFCAAFVLVACGRGAEDVGSPPVTAEEIDPADAEACPNLVAGIDEEAEANAVTDDSVYIEAQARLGPDAELIREYGRSHPDEFVGVRFVRTTPRPGYAVAFTDNLVEHCSALRDIVEYPDDFSVWRQAVSTTELARVRADIEAMADEGRLLSIGERVGSLSLHLGPGDDQLARRIFERHGDVIDEFIVGFFPFPDLSAAEPGTCGGLLPTDVDDSSPIEVAIEIEPSSVASGDDFSGNAVIRNVTAAPVTITGGATMVALLFRPGSTTPVAGYPGPVTTAGLGAALEPGDSVEIPLIGDTASCDPALGYAIPAGSYEARIVFGIDDDPDDEIEERWVLSDPQPVEVTG